MAFLHKIVNGGGFIDREYAVGSGRVDLCVRWPSPAGLQRRGVELKVWRDGRPDPLPDGLEQLADYLDLDGNLLITNDPYRGPTAEKGVISFKAAPEKVGLRVVPR